MDRYAFVLDRPLADLMGERGDVAELTDDAVSGP